MVVRDFETFLMENARDEEMQKRLIAKVKIADYLRDYTAACSRTKIYSLLRFADKDFPKDWDMDFLSDTIRSVEGKDSIVTLAHMKGCGENKGRERVYEFFQDGKVEFRERNPESEQ